VAHYVKRRDRAVPGSIPDVLGMFEAEIRFYREIAPIAGVRVPACYQAEQTADGTLLVLEDLSAWSPGADPAVAARLIAGMHRRWEGQAARRWPWLRPVGAGAELVDRLFGRTWTRLSVRPDVPPSLVAFGESVSGRVADAERAVAAAGPPTLVHGDASALNMRTGPSGEVALLDWEDVSAAPGVLDLAWLLTSSVEPGGWEEVIAAYGPVPDRLARVLPAVMVQGLLSMSDTAEGSDEAIAWAGRLEAAHQRLKLR
jgi:Phosphotransferase enzyme family